MRPSIKRVVLLTVVLSLASAAAERNALLLTVEDLIPMKKLAETSDPRALALKKAADQAMTNGPWSVTFARPQNTPAGPHDFYGEAPYWWPDPANPAGPYIRRDGETNPNRFVANDRDMGQMSQAVLALGMAAYLFDKPEYAKRAAKIISVWFLDDATKMSPNLEFGQAIHGRTTGRPTGLIGTRSLIWLVQGAMLAEQTTGWDPAVSAGLRQWFREFTQWMTTSKIGTGEAASGNNHASWWTAQVAAFAIFTNDSRTRDDMFRKYRKLLSEQIRPEGSQPREEERTKSLSYSAFNLDALALVCRLAQVSGKNLWEAKGKKDVTISTAIEYLEPWMLDAARWRKPQIQKFEADHTFFLGLAGLGLRNVDYLQAQRKIGLKGGRWADLLALLIEVHQ